MMDWRVCRREFIRDVECDTEMVAALCKSVEQRRKRASLTPVTEELVSFITEDYYEMSKELLTALLLLHGMRSQNHQCLITFLAQRFPHHEAEAHFIEHLCYLRNRLDYYGEQVEMTFFDANKEKMENVIDVLQQLVREVQSKGEDTAWA